MKKMIIWRRLNTSLAILIFLLVIGAALAWYVEYNRYNSLRRSDILTTDTGKVRLQLTQMSDSFKSLLLDPKNEVERKRSSDAENELGVVLEDIQRNFKDYSGLILATRNIRDFVAKTWTTYQTKIVEEVDPVAAASQYTRTYPALRLERERLLTDLNRQAQITSSKELDDTTVSIAGLVALGLILITSIGIGSYQSSAVTKPLSQLIEALERMRRGDFTKRLVIEQQDEFGIVGDGLNRLADDLSVLVGQVQRSGIQVNTTTTQIAATARQQQSTASEIAATTAEIGATSKQISATSRELVKTMNEVNEVSEETAQVAGSGQAAIASMEATMRHIMDASGSITAKLAVLNEKTSNINSVVTTITKVADQTNLLSLNAAIEAEKAGEYGLGFAVVAMEIRRLADQTAVATYDIEKMVKEMQSAVSAGVMGMDKFSEEVRRGAEEIRQVSTQLARIIHQVQALNPRFQTVNEGMQSQATGAQQISETLTQLSEAAHQTAESLRQSNQAIEHLNDAARGLQSSVSRFKLDGA
jgi:methyl-accepting chemotaxis protein WspA